jgi:hypothetical protein
MNSNRRDFIKHSTVAMAGLGLTTASAVAQIPGDRPERTGNVTVLPPCGRVPVSLIIDDSTCLVNLAHFGIPQFAQTFPAQYKQDWRRLPREIPDSFVRSFGEWCHEHGVKGKYSIVPYPACVGWVDRFLPGWSQKELQDSLDLVREVITPDWDIHPEMISHTRVIDIKTGRPYEDSSEYFMENWRWTDGKSVDQLAAYMAYALQILKNAGLTCEGITTPGGFGNRVLPELAQATLQACRSVYQAEIPHYFRHLFTDETSVMPRVEYASGLDTNDPKCVVSIIGCTGDWLGGWDGLEIGRVDQFITEDGKGGRLPEVIERGEPAVMVCHWPGVYCNGDETGFSIFKETVKRLHNTYSTLIWMKLSEIARYWAAKELASIHAQGDQVVIRSPFATPKFTVQVPGGAGRVPHVAAQGNEIPLREVQDKHHLTDQTWIRQGETVTVCFELPKGESTIDLR